MQFSKSNEGDVFQKAILLIDSEAETCNHSMTSFVQQCELNMSNSQSQITCQPEFRKQSKKSNRDGDDLDVSRSLWDMIKPLLIYLSILPKSICILLPGTREGNSKIQWWSVQIDVERLPSIYVANWRSFWSILVLELFMESLLNISPGNTISLQANSFKRIYISPSKFNFIKGDRLQL